MTNGKSKVERLSHPTKVLISGAILTFCSLCIFTLYSLQVLGPNWRALTIIIFSYLLVWSVISLSGKGSITEKASRFLLTTVAILITVGALELLVVAKLLDFRILFNTPQYEPWRNPKNILDPKLLHIPKPHVRSVWGGIEYRYDQHGFRNESDLEAADIIVIGDSIIEGPRVAAKDLVTAHLARQMQATVVNMGESWYGPQQEAELIRRYGIGFHPHLCVWNFFEGNDLFDAQRYKDATKDWQAFSADFHSFTERSFTKNAGLAVQRLFDSLFLGNSDEEQLQEDLSGTFSGSDGEKIHMYFLEQGVPLSQRDDEALEEVRESLIDAYQLCHGSGARFLVVFTPTKFRVYKSFTDFDGSARPREWVLNDLPNRIEAIVHNELPDGKYLDLTPIFIEHARKGSLVYFPGWDTHWSQEGHRVAASAISRALVEWDASNDRVSSR